MLGTGGCSFGAGCSQLGAPLPSCPRLPFQPEIATPHATVLTPCAPHPTHAALLCSCVLAMAGFALYSHTKIQKFRESSESQPGVVLIGICVAQGGQIGGCAARRRWLRSTCTTRASALQCTLHSPSHHHDYLSSRPPCPPLPPPACSGAPRHLHYCHRHRQRSRAGPPEGRGCGGAAPRRQRQHAAPRVMQPHACAAARSARRPSFSTVGWVGPCGRGLGIPGPQSPGPPRCSSVFPDFLACCSKTLLFQAGPAQFPGQGARPLASCRHYFPSDTLHRSLFLTP